MSIRTREEAMEDLSRFGIKEPYTYLLDIIPLIEMIWADGEAHEGELAVLDEYLHERVEQINEMAGYKAMDFEDARAFAQRFIIQKPQPEFLRMLRSLVGPILLSSSNSHFGDSLLRLMLEACIDIAASAVREYPYGLHDRFDPDEKRCFFEILMTFIDYARPEGMRKGCAVREIVTPGVTEPESWNHQGRTRVKWRKGP